MKAITLILLMVVFGKSCNDESKQDIKSAVIEYTANSRGFFGKIVVKDGKAFVYREREKTAEPKTITLSEADEKELIAAFQEIKLDEIAGMKPPTEKRFYDGAAMADLKIIYKEKTYQSQTFDHKYPPAGIEKLVNKLVSLIKEE